MDSHDNDALSSESEHSESREIRIYTKKVVITVLLVLLTLIVVLAIINFSVIKEKYLQIIRILKPFLYGTALAYILSPICNKLDNFFHTMNTKKVKDNDKESIERIPVYYKSIAIVETLLVILLIAVCLIVIPQSIKSISSIIASLPDAVDSVQVFVDKFLKTHNNIRSIVGNNFDNIQESITSSLKEKISINFDTIVSSVFGKATVISVSAGNIIMAIFMSIFILANRRNFSTYCVRLMNIIFGKKIVKEIIKELKIADRMFSGFFYGKLIDSLIVGVICLVLLTILRMPYALLVSIIVCITNIIPIVGPFIGAVPSLIIIFSESPIHSLYFLIFIIVLQQIDGHIIGPKCIGSATGLSTFWVLFSIIVFGKMFGIIGMLIGVPTQAVIFDILDKILNKLENRRNKLEKDQTELG